MEKRAILAFALSAALLFAYVWVQERFFTPPPAQKPAVQGRASGGGQEKLPEATRGAEAPGMPPAAPTAATGQPAGSRGPSAAATSSVITPQERPPQTTATVEGPLYRAVVSSEGGKFQEWTLRYRGDKPMVLVGDLGPTGLEISDAAQTVIATVPMVLDSKSVVLGSDRPTGTLSLTGGVDGLRVQETMTFAADNYTVGRVIRVANPGTSPRTVVVVLGWNTHQQWGAGAETFIGQRPTEAVWSASGGVGRISDLKTGLQMAQDGEWIGLDSVWYLSALVPKTPGFKVVATSQPVADAKNAGKTSGRLAIAVKATPTIAPGQSWEGEVLSYIGPKEYERLRALGLQEAIDFGGFPIPRRYGGLPMEWLGVPILLVMKWVYRYVGNYGLAIIILTVIIRVLFYPLTVKSMRSMRAMQALQPQVNALRSKYKSDPQRLQKETMELYRKYKVNPMGGCLPMVAQIPIFYALYLALSVSVELQSASFLCVGRIFGVDVWICDLASHDPTYVLPILMGVTMFVQQKMSPTTGDPRQARMMLIMPFVFTFMFLNLPSGLVLYWTVSNVLQILQQWYMDWPKARESREVKDASRA